MTSQTANFNSVNHSSRCQHRTTKGQQCRLPVLDSNSALCWRHVRPSYHQTDGPDLAALAAKLREFSSAAQVHEFLSSVLVLLAQNRIAPRRAAVFAYLCNMLLRTLSSIQLEEQAENDAPLRVDWSGIPRPDFSQESTKLS
jgi:hypothetical protein